MQTENGPFNNLIDAYIGFIDDPEVSEKPGEQFRKLLSGYFFQKECYDSKSMEFFFDDLGIKIRRGME